jgi:hypothetical protein
VTRDKRRVKSEKERYACRSATDSIFRLGLGILSNRLVLAGIAFELLLAAFIIYHPLGLDV